MFSSTKQPSRPWRYRLGRWIRAIVVRVIGALAPKRPDAALVPGDPAIRRILLVRVNFRMGNTILTLPAIEAVKKSFPQARIDFLGSAISDLLFRHQNLHRHYIAPRRFPRLLWEYPRLVHALRANRYDLVVDVSCSQSGAALFIIGLSGARIRAGIVGRGDRVLNLRVSKLHERDKYDRMTEFLGRLNLKGIVPVGALALSAEERKSGRRRLAALGARKNGKIIGIFVGGRKLRGKRWSAENFLQVAAGLRQRGWGVVVFLGPEEQDLMELFKNDLDPETPLIFEPAVRAFAAMVSHLDLFVCSDSGPMHLACALGVRVVAIFQQHYVERWAPPSTAARIVVDGTPEEVLSAIIDELSSSIRIQSTPSPSTEFTVSS